MFVKEFKSFFHMNEILNNIKESMHPHRQINNVIFGRHLKRYKQIVFSL